MRPENALWLLTALYSAVMLVALYQVILIFMNKHKRLSFQVAFLVLCFFWAVLRALYFGGYTVLSYFDQPEDPDQPNDPSGFVITLVNVIFWSPMNIQFAIFTLLVVYYFSLINNKAWQRTEVFIGISIVYAIANLAFVAVVVTYVILALVLPQDDMNDVVEPVMQGFAGVLFMVLVLLLAVFGYRLWTLSRQKSVPVAAFRGKHGSSLLFGVTFAIVLIYLLRSAYDFVTTSGVGLVTLNGHFWLIVGLYTLWEITPVSLVLFMFRQIPDTPVKKVQIGDSVVLPNYSGTPGDSSWLGSAYYPPGQQSSSIWNNPQRYDMPPDEQAGSAGTSGGSMPGYASPNFHYQVPPTNTPYSTTPVYQTDNMLLNDGEQ